ncbi:hypothetical protein CVT24_012591 [Panaeolus cyanescens]|uniref:Uncharacterized protein n=1 Tax=Panaeolus cyanescens TaxID=181874 RepID=A0A409X4I1_9AGAR|nr:hypothetical protein CVT24_012591 [Panaeolus cyanescens]
MFPAHSYNSQSTLMWLPIFEPTYYYPQMTMEDFDVFDTEDGRLWVYRRRPYQSGLHYDAYAPSLEHQAVDVPFEDIAMPLPQYPDEWLQSVVDEIEASIATPPLPHSVELDLLEAFYTQPQCQAGDPVDTGNHTFKSSHFLSSMSEAIGERWSVESQRSPFQDQRLTELSPPVQQNIYTDAGPIQTPSEVVERQVYVHQNHIQRC